MDQRPGGGGPHDGRVGVQGTSVSRGHPGDRSEDKDKWGTRSRLGEGGRRWNRSERG